MSVCILKNGDLYWRSHIGLANIEQNKPVTDSSCFLLASISKTITQTAILQMYEQGYYELGDNINDNLPFSVINPNFPEDEITYYQLMTHTSSIKDNWSIMNQVTSWGEDSQISLGEFLEGYLIPDGNYYNASNWYNNHPPGTFFDYSNIGNSVLGYLTESISGQELDDYCQEFIFEPLGINNVSFFLSGMDLSNLVTPYQYSGGSYTPHLQPGAPYYPAGALKISAIELSKFLGMYMKEGTFNGNTILNPETVDLTTTPVVPPWYFPDGTQMCLTWLYFPPLESIYHGGHWPPFCRTLMGYDKEGQFGTIFLANTAVGDLYMMELSSEMNDFAKHYKPISIEHISINETDGDQVIEAGEELSLGFTLHNYVNFPEILENATAIISVNNPYLSWVSDSVYFVGTINYLDEILIPDNQFVFEVSTELEPGNIEFTLSLSWDEGVGYTIPFNLFAGHAEVLLVRDEESENKTEDWYLQSLDSLGYFTNFYDLGIREELSQEFINTFPAVIWFTGTDEENTISENDQVLLSGYLDNGGRLFLSGQNISDELAGTSFLGNYLFVEHIEDTWIGQETMEGVENDPIGDGLSFQVNQGDGLANQYSMSVINPLGSGHKVFGYYPTAEGSAIRFDDNIYKTVFFGFGFEAIDGIDKRHEIMYRILHDYFDITTRIPSTNYNTNNTLQVFPNPFKSKITIEYLLNESSLINISILDITGKLIENPINKFQQQGENIVVYITDRLPKGIYFCVLKINEGIEMKKIIKL